MTRQEPALREALWEDASGIQRVPYVLTRCRRRNICLRLTETALEVRAPSNRTIEQIETVIRLKLGWIRRVQENFKKQKAASGMPDTRFEDGGLLPFRGRILCIRLGTGTTVPLASFPVPSAPGTLDLPLPSTATTAEIKQCILDWLLAEANRILPERLALMEAFAPRKASRLVISPARTRWGCCTTSGEIRLSWRLIFFDNSVIDYVAAHELAHLVEMNHSQRFWAVVQRIRPNYMTAKNKLKNFGRLQLPL